MPLGALGKVLGAASGRAESDSQSSDPIALLSEILASQGGYVHPEELQHFCNYAGELKSQQKTEAGITPAEVAWLDDFVGSIGQAYAADKTLDLEVEAVRKKRDKTLAKTEPKIYDVLPERNNEERIETTKQTVPKSWSEANPVNHTRPLPPIPTIKLNELVLKPEDFSGQRDKARRWLEDFESASAANGWSDRTMVRYVSTFFKGSARDWYTVVAMPRIKNTDNWPVIRSMFVRYYMGPDEKEAIKDELRRTYQKKDEPASDFVTRLLRLLVIVNPEISEQEQVKEIRSKLREVYQDKLIGFHPTTLYELNDLCLEIEKRLDNQKKFNEKRNKKNFVRKDGSDFHKSSTSNNKSLPSNKNKSKEGNEKPKYKCNHCHKTGHTEERCWTKNGKPVTKSTNKIAAIEPTGQVSKPPEVTTIRNVCSVVATVGQPVGIFHEVVINNEKFKAMFDTGSKLSIIRSDIAIGLNLNIESTSVTLVGANNQSIGCQGMACVAFEIKIGTTVKKLKMDFAIVDELCVPVLVGLELMSWLKLQVRASDHKIWFTDEPRKVRKETSGVRLVADEEIESRSQKVVSAIIYDSAPDTTVMTTHFNFTNSILTGNCVSKIDSDGLISCLLLNLEDRNVILHAGTQVACYEELNTPNTGDNLVSTVLTLGNTGETVQIGDNLDEKQTQQLSNLLFTYIDAFSTYGRIGDTSLIEHDIHLLDGAKPVVENLRRRPYAHKIETSRQIQHMLKEGIIEPSQSPWASAYVLVKKKTGDLRLCIDFRKLNDLTKKCSYPLPNIEDCLEPLCGNQYFSQLDLASGYWQIRMADKAKELTAFRTEDGLYQFTRMPFGLCNAPASFQRLVNALFSGLKGVHLQVFIDDICVATKTWTEHLTMLEKVFQLLIKANLRLKASKCTFGAKQVIFLGHKLSKEGIQQDPDKLKAFLKLPAPKNVNELRRVLGMLNYYRRFIPRFSQLAEPLTRLMCKNATFVWQDQQKHAFSSLLKEMSKNPVLATFNHIDPLALKTDASGVGLAGILLQQQEGEWRVITCCSRQLSKSEKNYGITDLEGAAIIYTVTKLRNYLLGKHFVILTDHCALCALRKKLPESKRLRRWALLLSEYDFQVQYIKGGLHLDVDCLSRAPVDDEPDVLLDEKLVAAINKSHIVDTHVCTLPIALNVPEWKHLSENDAEATIHFQRARQRQKGYKIYNGLLYFENRLYVPVEKRKDLLHEHHADAPANHGGVRATLERLKLFWWPTFGNDVKDFVRSCVTCQQRKTERDRPAGEMFSFTAIEPFELVAMDALGPLTSSLTGYKHVIVVIDTFTRFVDAQPVEDIKGETAAKFLAQYVGRFGIPKSILTDNSTTFCNQLVTRVTEEYKIEHRKTTPHHHEGNAVVERVIQTLQEKLALMTHDLASSVNWEEAVPGAVLSINTTVHTSTGYTPFELLFGTARQERSSILTKTTSSYSLYANLRELRSHHQIADAIARQGDVRCVSKNYFDSRHQPRTYEIGSLVLARLMGRRAKLQNRWLGPYKVVERKNDVYKIESIEGRFDTTERHTRDLKPYFSRATQDNDQIQHNSVHQSAMLKSTVALLACTVLIIKCSAFEEVPQVLWKPTKIYVSPGLTTVSLQIKIAPPCAVLMQFYIPTTGKHEPEAAFQLCQQVYQDQVINRLAMFNQGLARQPSVLVPKTAVVKPVFQSSSLGQPTVPQPKQGEPSYVSGIQSNVISLNQDLPLEDPMELSREKRGVMEFVSGCVASNILETVVDRLWPNPAIQEMQDRQVALEGRVRELNARSNFTTMQVQAISENVALQAKLVAHNIERIDAIAFQYPQLAVVSANIVSKLHLTGAYLGIIYASFRAQRPDLIMLHALFNVPVLLEIDPQSIVSDSIQFAIPQIDMLRVTFVGRRRSPTATVYEVEAFRYWGKLLEHNAELREYAGPKFLIYDSEANCVEGLNRPSSTYVTAQCSERNFEDTRLATWRIIPTSGKPSNHSEVTEYTEVWPFVYIYCYPEMIKIEQEISACPPFVFRLNASLHWNTSSHSYSPQAIEISIAEKPMPLILNVHEIHFKNQTNFVDKAVAIQKIGSLYQELDSLRAESTLITISNKRVSYQQYALIISGVGLLMLICLCYSSIWRGQQIGQLAERLQRERVNNQIRLRSQSYGHLPRRVARSQPEYPMITWQE